MIRFPMAHGLISGFRSVGNDRRANAAVELALAAPALFMFIFGIIELGYALWMQNALDYSVVVASRCASLAGPKNSGGGNTSSTCSSVTDYAASQSGADIASNIFSYSNSANCGCQVTASYPLPLNIPFISLSVTLSADACYRPPPSKGCVS